MGCFFKAELVVEDQLQNFPLSRREVGECSLKHHLPLQLVNRLIELVFLNGVRGLPPIFDQPEPVQRVPSPGISCGVPNHGEQPGFERRLSIVSSLPLQHFEIDHLHHFFSLQPIVQATTQSPTVTLSMEPLQLVSEF